MLNESVTKKILKCMIYATAFVPLIIFSDYISPFHFGKVVVFRSIVELMAVFYLLLVWQNKEYLVKTNKVFWSFLLFTIAFSVATALSIQPYQSFWGTLERMGGLWTFLHYLVFFIILTSVFKSKKEWLIFLDITVFVGLLSALYGFGQKTNIPFFIGGGDRARIFGTIGNAALFAGYQLLNLFLALTLLFYTESTKNRRIFFASSAFIMTVAVLMTAVRGSILGLGVGILLFTFLLAWNKNDRLAKKLFLYLAILALVFIASAFLLRSTSLVQDSSYLRRITDFSLDSITVQTRFWAWQAGLKGWSESFKTIVFGWGPENFNIPFSRYFNPKFFTGLGSETLFDRAHNMFVEVLVTMGLFGLVAYLGVFFTAIKELSKKLKERSGDEIFAFGLIPLIVAYMIHNSLIFDTSANFIVFFSVLGFISFLSGTGHGGDKNKLNTSSADNKVHKSPLFKTVSVFLLAGAVFLIYQTNIKQSEANYATTRAIVSGWNNDYDGAALKYKESISYDVPGKYEYRQNFGHYLLEYGADQRNLTPKVLADFKFVISEIKKDADNYPYDYLPPLYLSRLNIILGKGDPNSPYNDEALKYSMKALEISPTFVRTYYEIAQAYLNKADLNKAVEYFKKAVDLNPDTGISYWYWGLIEIQRGNVDLGLSLVNKGIQKGYALSEQDYLRLLDIYLKRNDFKNIAVIYEGLLSLKPDVAQYHASLAVAYVKMGRIDDAVKQARQAAQLDTSFESEARRFVQELGRQW
jgi:O-antigen ligase